MPRQAHINSPGALHNIICRGIERKKSFRLIPIGELGINGSGVDRLLEMNQSFVSREVQCEERSALYNQYNLES